MCTEVLNVAAEPRNDSKLSVPRADLWWYCRGKILRLTLPPLWSGSCAIVQLAIPFTVAYEKETMARKHRVKRRVWGTTFNNKVYIDATGVSRGVPDKFKARNQIAAGFESIIVWPTINKNVD